MEDDEESIKSMKSAQSSPEKSSEEGKNPEIPIVTVEATGQQENSTKKVISASLLDVPGKSKEKKNKKRCVSPVRLSSELRIKVLDQQVRIDSILTIKLQLAEEEAQLDLSEIDIWSKNLEENHSRFTADHNYLQGHWPVELLDHEYFTTNFFGREIELVHEIRIALARIQRRLNKEAADNRIDRFDQMALAQVPVRPLKEFSGKYVDWPEFKDIFTSIIINCKLLSGAQRLHQLKSCLTGNAAKLINGFEMVDESFPLAWEILVKRYDNKRSFIQEHLDQLCKLPSIKKRTSANLANLVASVTEANKALEALGVGEKRWDCLLVHHITRKLDKETREKWEFSLGSSSEYPSYAQLEEFLNDTARTLENVEHVEQEETAPKQNIYQKPSTAHHGTVQKEDKRYGCDCCHAHHYIAFCSKYLDLSATKRLELIKKKFLCFNCLGRHSARDCKCPHKCKTCSKPHHSSLHGVIKDYPEDEAKSAQVSSNQE